MMIKTKKRFNNQEGHVASQFTQEMMDSLDQLKEGEVVKGTIVKIEKNDVLIDIGYKSEGLISKTEFRDPDQIKINNKIDVFLEALEDSDGNLVLSKAKADKMKSWDEMIKAFDEGSIVEGRIIRSIKGGLIVDIGVDAFLPASQIDIKPVSNPQGYMGKVYKFKVVKINIPRKNVVVSRREFLEEERNKGREHLLVALQKGDIRKGIVKNITDFGAFIDLGGLDGLLHITDMSWGRLNHPSDMLSIGQQVEVMILDIDKEKNRVSLGIKQKTENPWNSILKKYPVSTKIKGKVVNMANYGAFVELEQGVEGLVHISEMSWTKRINHPSEVVKIGDLVEAVILNIDPDAQKISLGLKQIHENPWDKVEAKYHEGMKLKGILKNITDYGAFVELEDGIDGLLHISDISWTKRVNHPSEILQKNQELEVVVLAVDAVNKKISLGLKQLGTDPWDNIEEKYSIGQQVSGTIVKITKFGLFVMLNDGIEGLIHGSHLKLAPGQSMESAYKEQDQITAFIAKIDKEQRKLGLVIDQADTTKTE